MQGRLPVAGAGRPPDEAPRPKPKEDEDKMSTIRGYRPVHLAIGEHVFDAAERVWHDPRVRVAVTRGRQPNEIEIGYIHVCSDTRWPVVCAEDIAAEIIANI